MHTEIFATEVERLLTCSKHQIKPQVLFQLVEKVLACKVEVCIDHDTVVTVEKEILSESKMEFKETLTNNEKIDRAEFYTLPFAQVHWILVLLRQ